MSHYVIWDFDGTLAERKGAWTGALLEALEAERPGHGHHPDLIRPYLRTGFPWHETHITRDQPVSADEWWLALTQVFVRAYHEGLQLDHERSCRLCKGVREAYVHPKNWELFEDTIPTLKVLSDAGWKQVILSNHVPELSQIVEGLGIAPFFESIFNSAETGVEKPHPRAFRNVLTSIGQVESVWMLEDNMKADVEGAHAAGIRAGLVRKPHPDASTYFETLHEAAAFLIASKDALRSSA